MHEGDDGTQAYMLAHSTFCVIRTCSHGDSCIKHEGDDGTQAYMLAHSTFCVIRTCSHGDSCIKLAAKCACASRGLLCSKLINCCAALLQGSNSKAVPRKVVLARLKKVTSLMTWWQITRPSTLVDKYRQGKQHQSKQTSSLQLVSADGLSRCLAVHNNVLQNTCAKHLPMSVFI